MVPTVAVTEITFVRCCQSSPEGVNELSSVLMHASVLQEVMRKPVVAAEWLSYT